MTWRTLAATVQDGGSAVVLAVSGALAAVFGAGWIGTLLRLRAARRTGLASDVRSAQDSLQALRAALRKRARKDRSISDDVLADLLDDLDTAVYRTGCETVVDAARHYAEVGQAFASGDPDTSVTAEQEAYDRLAKALMVELDRNR